MPTVQCLFCQHLNPAHAAFCNECGQALKLRPCPQCQASNDRNATACQHCGAQFSDPQWQLPDAPAPSASGAASSLWSRARDGGMEPRMLSEMGATTNSARRRMFIAVAALAAALVAYGASVYFYGLPPQRAPIQAQGTEPATAPEDLAETPRAGSDTTPAASAPQEFSPETPDLPPAAVLGLPGQAAPSLSAPSPSPFPAPSSAASPAAAACPPAVAALGLCQPSPATPLTGDALP